MIHQFQNRNIEMVIFLIQLKMGLCTGVSLSNFGAFYFKGLMIIRTKFDEL